EVVKMETEESGPTAPPAEEVDRYGSDLNQLKYDLEGWREILLPINKFLEWDKPYHPAALAGSVTLIFAMIWYLEPSVLTTFSLFGLVVTLVDFLVPTIMSALFSQTSWTIVQERKYEEICMRLLNARNHLLNFRTTLITLKHDKPKVYLIVLIGMLAFLAWVGNLVDNLFLSYLIVLFIVMVPGLRRHGIIQSALSSVKFVIKRLIAGKDPKPKRQ
ncbi:unnamed protein product, partial [Owenia fusiformis]